jgi:hypothetical protein
LTLYGMSNLVSESEHSLDLMDPYQRDAKTIGTIQQLLFSFCGWCQFISLTFFIFAYYYFSVGEDYARRIQIADEIDQWETRQDSAEIVRSSRQRRLLVAVRNPRPPASDVRRSTGYSIR